MPSEFQYLSFRVFGKPEAQARPRKGKFGWYSPKSDWKTLVMYEAIKQRNKKKIFFDFAIGVNIWYFMPRPDDHFGSGKNYDILKASPQYKNPAPIFHTVKPDLDNLNKAIYDAIVDAKLLKDDSFIVAGNNVKLYWDEHNNKGTGANITIYQIREENWNVR
jgi:Holliday junction resolvase RusA-like endonuclease